MKINVTKHLATMLLAFAATFLLSGCGDSKTKKEIAEVDAALAQNQYQAQRFNSDASTISRTAEGFAKGYEGDYGGVARDAAAAYSTADQFAENDRQLRAYRQQLAGRSSGGIPTWVWFVCAGIASLIFKGSSQKKT